MAEEITHFKVNILIVDRRKTSIKLLEEALLFQRQMYNYHYKLIVDVCEALEDVKRVCATMKYDFVIFVVNPLQKNCLEEVGSALQYVPLTSLLGHVCILNGAKLPPRMMNVSYGEISSFAAKHGLHVLNGVIDDKEKCAYLAKRILIWMSGALGLRSGVPSV